MYIKLIIFLLLVCCAGASGQSPRSFVVNGKRIESDTFNARVTQMMNDVGVPGLSLAVIGDGRIAYYQTFGYKRLDTRERVDSNTIFEAASLSKTFLTYVVHRLIEEGKLDPDKPLYLYRPFPELEHDARYKLITTRMILSHSSGIENWRWYNNPDTLEILANPGEKYVYSGEGFEYLSRVVEVILGKSYEQYVEEMVIRPLGLKRTFPKYTDSGQYPKNYATGYNGFDKPVKKWKNDQTSPASGMHLTAADYATVLLSLFDGKHLSAEEIRSIYHPVIRLSDNSPALFFGMGLAVQITRDDTIVFHNGFNDGFESMMWYSVPHRCGLVILTNSEREHVMEKRMVELTTRFQLGPYFADDDIEQYPSKASQLLQLYREKGKEEMLSKIGEWEKEGPMGFKTINELGQLFGSEDTAIARKMLEDNVQFYPDSSVAWFALGQQYMNTQQYAKAYSALCKARDLKADGLEVGIALQSCIRMINKSKVNP
jgi:CubicO group peptidase (beta-lactamase class C family)